MFYHQRITHLISRTMTVNEIRAELSIKMLDLERAIDLGMPYSDLKNVYEDIKKLQYELILACCEETVTYEDDTIIE